MMAPTHVVTGAVLALPVVIVAPELAVVAALAAIVGSVLPDLDLFVGEHRKTLHHPIGYWVPAVPALALATVSPSATTAAAGFVFLGAAVHCVQDWFGASDSLRPWEEPSNRGVYLHRGRRWLPPKRWVRYDGSPEDVALALVLGFPVLFLYGPPIRQVTIAALVAAVLYGIVRKRVPRYVAPFVEK